MRFSDIPQFTQRSAYTVNVALPYLERHLQGWAETSGVAGGLDLDPDFQRGHVWTREKKIAYIEFLIRGGQSSRELLFNCSGWMDGPEGPIQCVDGKQRLDAVRGFMEGTIPVCGRFISEFDDPRYLNRISLIFHVNNLKTRQEVLTWYLETNSGGVVHTQEELDRVRALLEAEKEVSR
jgi:hypothetical protein